MILRFVVFGSGAVLMALEIVGSRVLAPYFGSSVYVWGSLISIFLAALSLGYYLGGVAADRWPRPGALALTLGTSGILILLLPVAARPILEAFAAWDLGPRASPLLASVVLFALPSVLMGVTSPFAIKLAATTLATVGNTAGVLYAISTAGSIVGTLLTAFVLIPAMGVRAILYALGVSLVVFSGMMAWTAVRALRAAATVAVLTLVLTWPAGAQVQCGDSSVLFERDTVYHRLRVEEDTCYRWLFFNRSRQGGVYLSNPLESPLRYPDYALLAWLFNPDIKRVLMVGLGAGSIPRRILSEFPQVLVDSVELDPVVADVAKRFFGVVENSRHRIFVQDGRRQVARADGLYDLIIMDAYNHEGIPFHLVTREFLQLTKQRLAPRGIIVGHVVGFLSGPNSKLFRAVYKTYSSEFPGLYPFAEGFAARRDEDQVRSIMLVATGRAGVSKRDLTLTLGRLRREKKVSAALLSSFVDDYYEKAIPLGDVPLLTDDYAPVDILPVWNWEPARR